ncbi:serine/threonine-protein kinase pelle-like [Phlebotomus argentipes]|uniref:serine/threonine-protein kinase pelle-like n=1 Tax=Phlebotomus argentipes TaxID=94469 RepID=UPI00289342DA|nr:serine/threonine-protein kinase pelle-like [Phlebotomus argentipes]
MQIPLCDIAFEFPGEGPEFVHLPMAQLPARTKEELIRIMDLNSNWRALFQVMKFPEEEISRAVEVRRDGMTSSAYLVMKLCESGFTVTDLFVYLSRTRGKIAMNLLQDLVDEKYRILLNNTANIRVFLEKISLQLEYDYRKNYRPEDGAEERGRVGPLDISDYMYDINPRIHLSYQKINSLTQKFRASLITVRGSFSTHFIVDDTFQVRRFRFGQLGHFELNTAQLETALRELVHLQHFSHRNIAKLCAFGIHMDEMCLLYGLAELSINHYILEVPPVENSLTLKQRLYICRGIARGLNFLHTHRERPLIHMNIRPENIYLSSGMSARIANFALACEGPLARDPPVPLNRLHSLSNYYPQEYIAWPHYISTKLDVHSFGVTMLKILVHNDGDIEGRQLLEILREIVDSNVSMDPLLDAAGWPEDADMTMCIRMLYLAHLCTQEDYNVRPEMRSVYKRFRQYRC